MLSFFNKMILSPRQCSKFYTTKEILPSVRLDLICFDAENKNECSETKLDRVGRKGNRRRDRNRLHLTKY